MKHSNETFKTTDLHLATALRVHGLKLLRVDVRKKPRRQGVFVFEDSPDRVDVTNAFFSSQLEQNIREYLNVWLGLKRLVLYKIKQDETFRVVIDREDLE